ncbi:MAG: hypothetical protein ACJAUP_000195 [Cellvibrionaceae bacterium]|jgi:hypothetical protein
MLFRQGIRTTKLSKLILLQLRGVEGHIRGSEYQAALPQKKGLQEALASRWVDASNSKYYALSNKNKKP